MHDHVTAREAATQADVDYSTLLYSIRKGYVPAKRVWKGDKPNWYIAKKHIPTIREMFELRRRSAQLRFQ